MKRRLKFKMDEKMRLNLTKEEIEKITHIAKDRKFDSNAVNTIYTETEEDKLIVFNKSYRFLGSLSSDFRIEENIRKKIISFNDNFKEIYHESIILISKLNEGIFFGLECVKRNISKLYSKNSEKINLLIDEVYPIGKTLRTFNPEEFQGVE